MEFKKLDVTLTDEEALALANRVLEKYQNTCTGSVAKDMLIALKAEVLEIEAPFNADGWNSGTVHAPKEYDGHDVILRERSAIVLPNGHTTDNTAYVLGFIDYDGCPHIVTPGYTCDLGEYAYKLIK